MLPFQQKWQSNTAAENRIKRVLKKYINFIESLLKLGKDEGLFKDGYNVSLNAQIVIAIHSGVLLQWYINRKELNGATHLSISRFDSQRNVSED